MAQGQPALVLPFKWHPESYTRFNRRFRNRTQIGCAASEALLECALHAVGDLENAMSGNWIAEGARAAMTAATARVSRDAACLLSMTFMLLFSLCSQAMAQSPTEPDYGIINSGRCEINVCTDFDFGDHVFRIYADGRPHTLHVIPPGICKCKRVQSADRNFIGQLSFTLKLPDGRSIGNISIVNTRPGRGQGSTCSGSRTTYENIERLKAGLEPAEGLIWRDDKFERYNAFRTKQAFGGGDFRKYYLVPRTPTYVTVGGRSELVAFQTPLITEVTGKDFQESGGGFSSSLQYSEKICFFQFFAARLTHSNRWPNTVQETIDFLNTRLSTKSKVD